MNESGGVTELAKEPVSKIGGRKRPCGFESHHLRQRKKWIFTSRMIQWLVFPLMLGIFSIACFASPPNAVPTNHLQMNWVLPHDRLEIRADMAVGSLIHLDRLTIIPLFSVKTFGYQVPLGIKIPFPINLSDFEVRPFAVILIRDDRFEILPIGNREEVFGIDTLPKLMQIAVSYIHGEPFPIPQRGNAASTTDIAMNEAAKHSSNPLIAFEKGE